MPLQIRRAPPPGYSSEEMFWYVINPAQMTPNQQNVQAQLLLDSDADFLWTRLSGFSTWAFQVYLEDMSRAIRLIGNPYTPMSNDNIGVLSNAEQSTFQGYWLPKPYLLPRNTVLQATFNNTAASINQVQLALIGQKVQ